MFVLLPKFSCAPTSSDLYSPPCLQKQYRFISFLFFQGLQQSRFGLGWLITTCCQEISFIVGSSDSSACPSHSHHSLRVVLECSISPLVSIGQISSHRWWTPHLRIEQLNESYTIPHWYRRTWSWLDQSYPSTRRSRHRTAPALLVPRLKKEGKPRR